MPILAPLAPAAAAGGGTATIGGGGTAILGGITAAQVATAGVVIVSALTVGALLDDYLDTPVGDREAEDILAQAGDKSKADRRALDDCVDCQWCQINIQAQGTLIYGAGSRPAIQGIGPYLVQGRTVSAREGVIIAGLTHEFVSEIAGRRSFKQIERWDILGRTVAFIQSRPPGGLPFGEHRVGNTARQDSQARYDIMVNGTIFAFMVP